MTSLTSLSSSTSFQRGCRFRINNHQLFYRQQCSNNFDINSDRGRNFISQLNAFSLTFNNIGPINNENNSGNGDSDEDEIEKVERSISPTGPEIPSSPSFDFDFADAMSKPLPEWYKQQKEAQQEVERELIENRERIVREFKEKYEISASAKVEEINNKWESFEERSKRRKEAAKTPWLQRALGISVTKDKKVKTVRKTNADGEVVEEEEMDEETTKEKWEKFWVDEQESTGFYLPGFFEVFPELKLKWPNWAKRRNGSAIKCETDQDCQFPQACCPHPIIPGEKFCCTGFGRRIMVPALQAREITRNDLDDGKAKEKAPKDGRSWGNYDFQ